MQASGAIQRHSRRIDASIPELYISDGLDIVHGRNVSHHQFEKDLTHLERIVPQLVVDSALGLVYWHRRIAVLKTKQALLPDGARRVMRLLLMLDQIENSSTCT